MRKTGLDWYGMLYKKYCQVRKVPNGMYRMPS